LLEEKARDKAEGRKKKRKKRNKSFSSLEDEDLELIADNTGFGKKKAEKPQRKRLTKQSELEKGADQKVEEVKNST
jgi:hypothetical protein